MIATAPGDAVETARSGRPSRREPDPAGVRTSTDRAGLPRSSWARRSSVRAKSKLRRTCSAARAPSPELFAGGGWKEQGRERFFVEVLGCPSRHAGDDRFAPRLPTIPRGPPCLRPSIRAGRVRRARRSRGAPDERPAHPVHHVAPRRRRDSTAPPSDSSPMWARSRSRSAVADEHEPDVRQARVALPGSAPGFEKKQRTLGLLEGRPTEMTRALSRRREGERRSEIGRQGDNGRVAVVEPADPRGGVTAVREIAACRPTASRSGRRIRSRHAGLPPERGRGAQAHAAEDPVRRVRAVEPRGSTGRRAPIPARHPRARVPVAIDARAGRPFAAPPGGRGPSASRQSPTQSPTRSSVRSPLLPLRETVEADGAHQYQDGGRSAPHLLQAPVPERRGMVVDEQDLVRAQGGGESPGDSLPVPGPREHAPSSMRHDPVSRAVVGRLVESVCVERDADLQIGHPLEEGMDEPLRAPHPERGVR